MSNDQLDITHTKDLPPVDQNPRDFQVALRIRRKTHCLNGLGQILGDGSCVSSIPHQAIDIRKMAAVLVSSFWGTGHPNWVPDVVEYFVHSPIEDQLG